MRHILDEVDTWIINHAKASIYTAIRQLLKRGVRPQNIEIELHSYIKELLKGD